MQFFAKFPKQINASVSFFSGSKKNMLDISFKQRCTLVRHDHTAYLKRDCRRGFYSFCCERLSANLPEEVLHLYMLAPMVRHALILQICARWHGEGLSEITMEDMNEALLSVIDDYDDEYRHLFMNLPAMQRKAVMAIGLSGGRNVFQKGS